MKMTKKLATIHLVALFLFGLLSVSSYSYAKNKNFAKKTEQERNVDAFDKINVDGFFNVVLIQGNTNHVKISAREDDAEYAFSHIKTKVKNGELFVDFKEDRGIRIHKNMDINVYITFKNIQGITHDGSGALSTEGQIEADKLSVDMDGSGSETLALKLNKLNLSKDGSGSLNLSGSVRVVKVSQNGSGSSKFDLGSKIEELNLSKDGSGRLSLSGEANSTVISKDGSGSVFAYDLEANNMVLHSDGSGSIKVNVTKDLKIDASGSGSIRYKGNPTISKLDVSGSGSVKSAN